MTPSTDEANRLINNPHDAFFKHLLGRRALAIEFLRLYLPKDVTAELNLQTLERVVTTFVREDLREYFSDLIFSLSQFLDEQIKGSPALRAGLLAMKYIFHKDLGEKLGDIARLLKQLPGENVKEHLEPLATYVAATTTRLTAEEMERKLSMAIPKKKGGIMPTLLETWIQKGLQQGLHQGLQQGRREGTAQGRHEQALEMTLRQLEHQIGQISARAQTQVRRLSLKQLGKLSLDLLKFTKAADLFAWLRKNKLRETKANGSKNGKGH